MRRASHPLRVLRGGGSSAPSAVHGMARCSISMGRGVSQVEGDGGGGRGPPPSSRMSAMMPAHASGGSYPSRDLLVRRQQALLEVRRRRMSLPRESSTQAHPLRARDAVTLLLALDVAGIFCIVGERQHQRNCGDSEASEASLRGDLALD